MTKKTDAVKNITLKVEEEIWKELKMRALDQSMTLKAWILQAIAERIARENLAK